MRKVMSYAAALAIASNILIAGGDIVPMEPIDNMPKKQVVVVADNVKYDGFYAGASLGHMKFKEGVNDTTGKAITLIAGYYFNQYIGIEGRYSKTVADEESDLGGSSSLSNMGIYLKPMYSVTSSFALYGLAGYGKSTYKAAANKFSETGVQWGLGAKLELANGVGFFADYMNIYDGDNYDGLADSSMDAINVGATYTFY